jgi:hypothetical protein
MRFTVEIKGGKEITRLLKRAPKEKEPEVKAAVGDVALKMQARAKAYLRTQKAEDTGHLSGTILAEFSPITIEAEIGPTAKYGPYVEFGTRPHFPPLEALESWARHHGFESAWPICKAISKRGIKPRPYLSSAYEDFKGELVIRLEQVMGKKWE